MVLIASVSKGGTIFQIISAAAPRSILEIVLALSLLEESEGVVGELHLRPTRRAVSLKNRKIKTQPHAIRSCILRSSLDP